MLARRVVGVALIAGCYMIAILLLVGLSAPFSPGRPRFGNGAILTIAGVVAAPVWAASALIIRRFMLNPQGKAVECRISSIYASILLVAAPGFSILLGWMF